MKLLMKSLLVGSVLFLAACNSDNDPVPAVAAPPAPATLKVQVLHASPDAPTVNVLVDDTEILSGVDYKQGSDQIVLDEGTYSVRIDGILPAGPATVIGPVDLNFSGDTIYTIAAVNSVAAIEPVVISQPDIAVAAGAARLFVLHGAAGAPQVDVYVTTPGADLAASAPVGISTRITTPE